MSSSSGFKEYHYRRVWNIKYYFPHQLLQSVEVLEQTMVAVNQVFEDFCSVCCEKWETGLLEPLGCFHRTGFAAEVLLKSAAKTTDLKELLKNFGLYECVLWSKFVNENDEQDWLESAEGSKYPEKPVKSTNIPFDISTIPFKPLYLLYNKYLNTSYEDPRFFIESYKQEQAVFDAVFPRKQSNSSTSSNSQGSFHTKQKRKKKDLFSEESDTKEENFSQEKSRDHKGVDTSPVDDDSKSDSLFSNDASIPLKTSFPRKAELKSKQKKQGKSGEPVEQAKNSNVAKGKKSDDNPNKEYKEKKPDIQANTVKDRKSANKKPKKN